MNKKTKAITPEFQRMLDADERGKADDRPICGSEHPEMKGCFCVGKKGHKNMCHSEGYEIMWGAPDD